MKKIAIFLTISLFIILCHVPVFADSIRCGGKLVTTGESKFDVIKTCGEPLIREIIGVRTVKYGASYTSFQIEQWTYDMGNSKFPKVLTFYGSTLMGIENRGW